MADVEHEQDVVEKREEDQQLDAPDDDANDVRPLSSIYFFWSLVATYP